ncbi:MAG: glycosyltransferase family 2 protein [Planctomycetes bacterium]|nr:glycosyltransferase family 2 protein [Planctomycetota bacterium]
MGGGGDGLQSPPGTRCGSAGRYGRRKVMRTLIAIPVYNERKHVTRVLERVREYASDILVIDDGSTDDTPMLLAKQPVEVIRHAENRGYGHSLLDAFRWARVDDYDWVITMDCDEQHEPAAIPRFLAAAARGEADVISGSRYLDIACQGECPPEDRRAINAEITGEINDRLGLSLTDAFCGFKAYRVQALSGLRLNVQGYAFPMQFWVQAVAHGLTIREIPVKLIYNDLNRTFGGPLDDPKVRLGHYREELHAELRRSADRLPVGALADVATCCQLG